MKWLMKTLSNILRRGGFAFLYYPVSMLFATCLAFLSIWIILAEPDSGRKMLASMQWAFAFGVFLNMALCVISKKADGGRASFLAAGALSLLASAGVFFAVYYGKGTLVSSDSITRVLAGIVISLLVFVFVPSFHSKKIRYNQMVFMTLKSFFIAAVYGLVIMLGCFFIAFAVESLLIPEMSSKVYSYIAILSGLFAYAFFLGYFPEFKKEEDEADPRIDTAIRQPRFAEILFQNIMIPIFAALTLVLLIWSIRILITREWPDYSQTITIFTTYSLVGIFLYYLVGLYETAIVRWYKRIVPVATLVFLAIEAYPILNRIGLYGVKPGEYATMSLWLYAVVTSLLFLLLPIARNRIPTYVAIVLIAVIVMPGVGAMDLSFTLQSRRLELLLTQNSMLSDGRVVPGNNIALKAREDITDATNYLFGQENRAAPAWLLSSMPSLTEFPKVYGFTQEFYQGNGQTPGNQLYSVYLHSEYGPVALENYQFYLSKETLDNTKNSSIPTAKSTYILAFTYLPGGGKAPAVTVSSGQKEVLKGDLEDYKTKLAAKYPVGSSSSQKGDLLVPAQDLTFVIAGDTVQIKVVLQSVTFTTDPSGNPFSDFQIQGIYFKEIG